MGGSGSGGGGGGTWIETGSCGGEFAFLVTIITVDMREVWNTCSVGDKVCIQITNDTIPKMQVIREQDGFVIGVVPPSKAGLLKCIKEGWKYRGKIIDKVGSEHKPQVKVIVKGE